MNNFFCNHKTQKSDPEHTFSEIDINYRRDYSKGKSFKVSIWNEIDTYNNDDFIQDFVIYNQSLWARIDSTPSTNEVPTEGPWTKVMDGVSDVQFKEDGNKIFWKYEDESEWKDLFELDIVSESEIKNMLKDIATDVDSNFYDKTLSETSINAVQNKVITQALNKKADKTELSKKQDIIPDLSEIRNKAQTALQSVPSEYVTESELTNKGYLTEHQDISGKQDKIADLAQIRANAQKGATALQTVPAEYATKTDVSNEVAKIVNSAPKAFDTLKEIADWIEEDAEPAIVLANKVEQKVDKVEGLGLSEENYTAEDKEKLEGLENYDDSGIRNELANKADKSEIPTKMSQLEQDVEIGSSYDDTEVKNELARLEREKATKSELTELSEEIDVLLDEKLYAYPVEIYEGPEPKVVGLGGDKLYNYLGEISIPADMQEIEGTLPSDALIPSEYTWQPTYEGVLQPYFEFEQDTYLNLYIGNDKYGYTSLKIEPSEDSNNLKWFDAMGLGMWQEGPGYISFAYSNWTLHYKVSYVMPCNIKVYCLYKAQKLNANLIPQEIARKEDVEEIKEKIEESIKEKIENYEYPTVTVDADTKTYSGELGSKYINIDINLLSIQFGNGTSYGHILQLLYSNNNCAQYGNYDIIIMFSKENNNILNIFLKNPVFTYNSINLDTYDYKACDFTTGSCRVCYAREVIYPATLDDDDYVTTLIDGKYIKYKLNRETHLLELQSEIDLSSIESRLAALESINVNIEATLNTEV